jgi:transcriptional regulator with XRE-family HTH domain
VLKVKPDKSAVPAEGVTIAEAARRTGLSVYTLRYYERAGLESHRDAVLAQLAEIQESLKILDHQIDVYRGSLAAGEADSLWAPVRTSASGG